MGLKRLRLQSDNDSLVVVRNGNIGDHLVALPIYRALRAAMPNKHLTLVTASGGRAFGREFLQSESLFDEIYDIAARGAISYRLTLRRLIYHTGARAVLYLPSDKARTRQLLGDAAAMRLARVRYASVFRKSKLRLFKRAQVHWDGFPRETERLAAIASEVGIQISPPDSTQIAPSADGPTVAICPGAGMAVNRWPPDRFASVAQELQRVGASIIVLGGPEDVSTGRAIVASLRPHAVTDLTGRTDLLEAARVLRACDCVVSNDTGLGHLASAVGTPVVTVFSSRDFPNSWRPSGHSIGLRHSVSCEVCYRRTCPTMHCIHGVSAEMVVAAVNRLLRGDAGMAHV